MLLALFAVCVESVQMKTVLDKSGVGFAIDTYTYYFKGLQASEEQSWYSCGFSQRGFGYCPLYAQEQAAKREADRGRGTQGEGEIEK